MVVWSGFVQRGRSLFCACKAAIRVRDVVLLLTVVYNLAVDEEQHKVQLRLLVAERFGAHGTVHDVESQAMKRFAILHDSKSGLRR